MKSQQNMGRAVDSGPNCVSEGQRRLRAVDASLAKVAEQTGCSKALVGFLRSGDRVPGAAVRKRLFDAYSIPVDAWDAPPGTESQELDDSAVPSGGFTSTLAAVDAQLTGLYELQRLGGLTSAARLKLADTLGKLLALKARLERERESLEDSLVREHPAWRRIREALIGSLRAYPDAAKATAEALRALDRECVR